MNRREYNVLKRLARAIERMALVSQAVLIAEIGADNADKLIESASDQGHEVIDPILDRKDDKDEDQGYHQPKP